MINVKFHINLYFNSLYSFLSSIFIGNSTNYRPKIYLVKMFGLKVYGYQAQDADFRLFTIYSTVDNESNKYWQLNWWVYIFLRLCACEHDRELEQMDLSCHTYVISNTRCREIRGQAFWCDTVKGLYCNRWSFFNLRWLSNLFIYCKLFLRVFN